MQPVQGPDGKQYQFPDGTTKEQAISYFRKNGITAAPSASSTDITAPREGWWNGGKGTQLQKAQPTLAPGQSLPDPTRKPQPKGSWYQRRMEKLNSGDPLATPAMGNLAMGAESGALKVMHMPVDILDAATKPPQTVDEAAEGIGNPGTDPVSNAVKRMLVRPSIQEAQAAADPTLPTSKRVEHGINAVPVAGGVVTPPIFEHDNPRAAGDWAAQATAPIWTPPVVDAAVNNPASRLVKRSVGKTLYPMADRMNAMPPIGEIDPVQSFTPNQVKSHAEGSGITLTPAEITESGVLRAVQGVGEKSAFGKGVMQNFKDRAVSRLFKRQKDSAASLSPKTPTTELAASELQKRVREAAGKSNDAVNAEYAAWKAAPENAGTIDVDMGDVNQHFQNIADANKDVLDNVPQQQAGTINEILNKAKEFGLKGEEVVDGKKVKTSNPSMDLEAVREMRSHWLDYKRQLARKGAGKREMQLVSDVVDKLDEATETAIRRRGEMNASGKTAPEITEAGEAAVKGWRKANELKRVHEERFSGDDSVLAEILDTGKLDMQKLVKHTLEKSADGGNPVHIRQLREVGVDLGPLQREVEQRILRGGYRGSQNMLGGFSDDFLQQLFSDKPAELDTLYKNARVGRSIGFDFNPSNTGGTLAARAEVESVPRALVSAAGGSVDAAAKLLLDITGVGYGAAKLSTADWFRNWMTRTPESRAGKWLLSKDKTKVAGADNLRKLARENLGPGEGPGPEGGSTPPTPPTTPPSGGGGGQPTPPPSSSQPGPVPGQPAPKSGKGAGKLRRADGGTKTRPAGDTSFDFGANAADDEFNKPDVGSAARPRQEPEPQWPSEYQGGPQSLDSTGGGGANYSADQLREFKLKHGISDLTAGQGGGTMGSEEAATSVTTPKKLKLEKNKGGNPLSADERARVDEAYNKEDRGEALTVEEQALIDRDADAYEDWENRMGNAAKDLEEYHGKPKLVKTSQVQPDRSARAKNKLQKVKQMPQPFHFTDRSVQELVKDDVRLGKMDLYTAWDDQGHPIGTTGVMEDLQAHPDVAKIVKVGVDGSETEVPIPWRRRKAEVVEMTPKPDPDSGPENPEPPSGGGGRSARAKKGWETRRARARERLAEIEPEGPKREGTGPGAMLARGASLGPQMRPGPAAGPGRVLYHGTHIDSLPAILKEGLRNSEELVGANSADSSLVNLTRERDVADFYASNGADAEGSPKSQTGVILDVEVPRSAIDYSEHTDYLEYLRTGKWPHAWPNNRVHSGLASEPGEFQIVRSHQPVAPELIKKATDTNGNVVFERGAKPKLVKSNPVDVDAANKTLQHAAGGAPFAEVPSSGKPKLVKANGSGESAASLEAISAAKSDAAKGVKYVAVKAGRERPIIGLRPEDNPLNPGEKLYKIHPDGRRELIK